jgi:DNA invertase Pin-like site-specific DNA recombinase
VSTDKQENSFEVQQARLIEAAKKLGLPVKVYADFDVSARKIALHNRPEGKRMCEDLEPGDHVFFTSISRGFRRAAECIQRFQTWWEMGITAHMLDMNVDMSTPYGRAILGYMAVGAELESDLNSERRKEIVAHKRKTDQPYNQIRPWGWIATKDKRGKLKGWAIYEPERQTVKLIRSLREAGASYRDIVFDLSIKYKIKKPHAKGGDTYYQLVDVVSLLKAAANGYPRLPRAFWQARDYAQKLDELRLNGDLRLREECIHS